MLSLEEANVYRKKLQQGRGGKGRGGRQRGAPMEFDVDPGWDTGEIPAHAVSQKSPEGIKAIYAGQVGEKKAVVSFSKPESGARCESWEPDTASWHRDTELFLRICEAAGFVQPLYTHVSGGITGSARYKWEQENGIYQFDKKPTPKLLASIANAEWDAMMWGPYFHDRPEYYTCWIDFCRKFHPKMKFYLSDAWLQLYQLDEIPTSESYFTEEIIERMGTERGESYAELIGQIREQTVDDVYILPTCDAMTLAAKAWARGELPGVEGFNKVIGGKERSLWRDKLGHLGPGFERLEGYVFYATIYGKSPEGISGPITWRGGSDFPGDELDKKFRRFAWQAVINHPLSGVKDENGDGVADVVAEE